MFLMYGYQAVPDILWRGSKIISIQRNHIKMIGMSRSTEEELGRRMFRLNMQKAVEESLEKIRRNAESEWTSFSSEEIMILKSILSEVWVSIERTSWENMVFSRLTKEDIEEIIRIKRDLDEKKKTKNDAISNVETILSHPGSL